MRILVICILLMTGVFTAVNLNTVPAMAADIADSAPSAPELTLSLSGKTVIVSWGSAQNASGFEVYKLYKDVWKRYKTVYSNAAGSLTMTGSYNCSYTWKIRSFILVNGEKVYGSFCKSIKIKTPPSGYPGITYGKAEGAGANVITFNTIHKSCEGYEIWRAEGATGKFKRITSKKAVDGSSMTYKDTKISSGTIYYYKVRGFRTNGDERATGNFSDIKAVLPYEANITSSANSGMPARKTIFVGDSRMLFIRNYCQQAWGAGTGIGFLCESGVGIDFLTTTLGAKLDAMLDGSTDLVFWIGTNDPDYVNRYITYYKSKIAAWTEKGAKVYIVSVGPVEQDPWLDNEGVEAFNAVLKAGISGTPAKWLDVYTYLKKMGFSTIDGLHYGEDTSLLVFDFILRSIGRI